MKKFTRYITFELLISITAVTPFSRPLICDRISRSHVRTGAIVNESVELFERDIEDIIEGAVFLGSGGGGPKHAATDMLHKKIFPTDPIIRTPIKMVSLDTVEDNANVIVSVMLGSPDDVRQAMTYEGLIRSAKEMMHKNNIETVDYVVPMETGAGNSIAPMVVARHLNIPIVDADGAGRAVPKLSCCTFGLHDSLLNKGFAVSDSAGTKGAFISAVDTASVAEDISQTIANNYGDEGALAIWLMKGLDLKRYAVPGGLSKSQKIGNYLRDSSIPFNIDQFLDFLKDMHLESEIIVRDATVQKPFKTRTVDDLDQQWITLHKDNDIAVTVCGLNENLIAYSTRKAEPIGMAPDLMCWIASNGESTDNSSLATYDTISAIAIHADAKMRNMGIKNAFMDIIKDNFGYCGSNRSLW